MPPTAVGSRIVKPTVRSNHIESFIGAYATYTLHEIHETNRLTYIISFFSNLSRDFFRPQTTTVTARHPIHTVATTRIPPTMPIYATLTTTVLMVSNTSILASQSLGGRAKTRTLKVPSIAMASPGQTTITTLLTFTRAMTSST